MSMTSRTDDAARPAMLGDSAALLEMLDLISRLARVDRPVLILGERGSGKELVADRLHFLSGRWDGPLIRTNCAALSEGVLDSELFGHEAGAFTGAVKRHAGRFERADGGTLFLDEIATAPLAVQEKLLRAVEYGEIERVGGTSAIRVDVRVVAATNTDLRAEVGAGRFRADLLDRLAFDVIRTPPLRERVSDIPLLVDHFGRAMASDLGWNQYSGFSAPAMAAMAQHHWPGNIRELRGAVERSIVRAADRTQPIAEVVLDPFGASPAPLPPLAAVSKEADAIDPVARLIEAARTIVVKGSFDHRNLMATIEKAILADTLVVTGNSLKKSSEYMRLSYDQLRSLMKRHGSRIRGKE